MLLLGGAGRWGVGNHDRQLDPVGVRQQRSRPE